MTRRPRAIIWCEWLGLLALILRIASAVWGDGAWRIAQVDAVTARGTGIMLIGFAIVAPTALCWWATRGRSRAAVWFFVAWIALLVAAGIIQFAQGSLRLNSFGLVALSTLLLYLVMAGLLFGRAARLWLRNKKDAAEIADLFT